MRHLIKRLVDYVCRTNFPFQQQLLPLTSVGVCTIFGNDFESNIYLATPKKRRTIERRRTRRLMSFAMDNYQPRNDLVSCPVCGFLNPRGFICSNCYDKVREESYSLRSLVGKGLPFDCEVRFVYTNDQGVRSTHPSTSSQSTKIADSIRVDRPRPTWFVGANRQSSEGGKE